MSSGSVERPAVVRSAGVALVCVGVGLVVVCAAEAALLGSRPTPSLGVLALPAGAALGYGVVGLLAWWWRPSIRPGVILLAGATVWLAMGLANLAVAGRPGLANAANRLQLGAGLAVVATTAGLLGLRRAMRPQRRVPGRLYRYGAVGLLAAPLVPSLLVPAAGISSAVSGRMQIVLLTVVPIAFAAATRLVGFARTGEPAELELRANQQELRLSRIRIQQVADQERRKIAQDLHDGLQADLVLLALQAQQLAVQPGTPPATAAAAGELRTRIDRAAADLRNLVRSVMPAPLVERGLAEATEDLVDRIPVPTLLDFDVPQRLPTLVASTAYFIVAEALGNAVKHASASALTVRLAQRDHTLLLEVSDDGVGGAHPTGGLGLPGLADRVDALGGRLSLESPTGEGTRILVELPCGS